MQLSYVGTFFPSMKGFTKTDSDIIYVFGSETEMMNKGVKFRRSEQMKCELQHSLKY